MLTLTCRLLTTGNAFDVPACPGRGVASFLGEDYCTVTPGCVVAGSELVTCNATSGTLIDLSYLGLTGVQPTWLQGLPPAVATFNLSHNMLTQEPPTLTAGTAVTTAAVDLSYNQLAVVYPSLVESAPDVNLAHNAFADPCGETGWDRVSNGGVHYCLGESTPTLECYWTRASASPLALPSAVNVLA